MFTILDYSSALEYSIIRRYTNIVYYNVFICVFCYVPFKKRPEPPCHCLMSRLISCSSIDVL